MRRLTRAINAEYNKELEDQLTQLRGSRETLQANGAMLFCLQVTPMFDAISSEKSPSQHGYFKITMPKVCAACMRACVHVHVCMTVA